MPCHRQEDHPFLLLPAPGSVRLRSCPVVEPQRCLILRARPPWHTDVESRRFREMRHVLYTVLLGSMLCWGSGQTTLVYKQRKTSSQVCNDLICLSWTLDVCANATAGPQIRFGLLSDAEGSQIFSTSVVSLTPLRTVGANITLCGLLPLQSVVALQEIIATQLSSTPSRAAGSPSRPGAGTSP